MSVIDLSSAIDWSKAPCDATHYAPNSDAGLRACWYKMVDGEWFYLTEAQDFGDSATWQRSKVEREDKVERPEQWAGEGLPPVGTVCEFKACLSGEWSVVEVKYLSSMTVILFHKGEHGDAEGAYSPDDCVFRPIKTPEQIAAEEREEDLKQFMIDYNKVRCVGERLTLERLYNLGYRKTKPE